VFATQFSFEGINCVIVNFSYSCGLYKLFYYYLGLQHVILASGHRDPINHLPLNRLCTFRIELYQGKYYQLQILCALFLSQTVPVDILVVYFNAEMCMQAM